MIGFWLAVIDLFWRTRNDFELVSLTIIPMGLAMLLPLRGFPRRITDSGIQLWSGNVIRWADIGAIRGLDFLGFKLFYREGEKIKEVAVTNLRPFWLVWETIRRNAPHAQVDPDWFPVDAIDLSGQDGKLRRTKEATND